MAGYPLNHWNLPGALSSRISLYFLLSSLLFVCIYIYDAVLRRIPHITTVFTGQMERSFRTPRATSVERGGHPRV